VWVRTERGGALMRGLRSDGRAHAEKNEGDGRMGEDGEGLQINYE